MQPKIIDFGIVKGTETSDVAELVQKHIAHGWQPWGSMSICNRESIVMHVQPMVKYEEDSDAKQEKK